MAEQKKGFPMLPIAHWWALRKKFKQSIPGVVTDSYLATVLEMGANSARANVLPFLKTLGIIDEEGKTGERAKQWRDDGHYAAVCKEVLKEVYPKELVEAVSDPVQNRAQAERWFANKTGAGAAAVKRMAALYEVIAEADASKQPEQEKGERVKKSERAASKPDKRSPARPAPPNMPPGARTPTQALQAPGININLEIHISADSTPDQIDAIFESMAKHIYKRG
jgi:hypothetical protein